MDDMRMELREMFLGEEDWSKDALKWLMEESDTKAKMLSEATGIKESSIRMYMSGYAKRPSLSTLIKMANYFRVPVDFLLGRCSSHDKYEIFKNYGDYFKALRSAAYDAYLINKYDIVKDSNVKSVSVYPYNLIDDVLMCYSSNDERRHIDICDDGLNTALSRLSEREQDVIEMKYHLEMTMNEIAEAIQTSRESARYITEKAIRKLRHPENIRLIRYGVDRSKQIKELNERENEVKEKEAEIDKRLKEIEKREKELGVLETSEDWYKHKPIEYMELTARCYNSLKRHGIDTIGDLTRITREGRLQNVRNLGVASIGYILYKLKMLDVGDYYELYPWIEEN